MDQTQILNLVTTLSQLIIVALGVLAVTNISALVAVVLLVHNARQNKALEQAVAGLITSAPAPVQNVVKEVGQLGTEVGGFIGDVTATLMSPSATLIVPPGVNG